MDDPSRLSRADGNADPLDGVLSRVLAPPALPEGFAAHVRAAIARGAGLDPARRRSALEQEWRALHARLAAGRRRIALTAVIALGGGTVIAAASLSLALPWMRSAFGADSFLLLPWLGIALGAAIAAPWRGGGDRLLG